jgi:acetoin utilization deacetylase AcuC-like enzyme
VVEAALRADLITVVSNPGFDPDTVWADIARVHDPAYVAAVRTGTPRRLAESQGFHWSPEFAESLARIWDGHQVAARLALTERVVLHPVSGAHHAQHDHGSGFCTFNFLVGAGTALLEEGAVNRVGIIDLDAHMGDGTLALMRDDRRFGLFDIASSSGWYGRLDSTRHLFQPARDADGYFAALKALPAFLDRFKPELVMYQAGMDCFEGDSMGAVRGLTEERLGERDRSVLQTVTSRGIPVVVNLAGGYLEDGTTERLHVETIRVMAEVLSSLPRPS